MSLLRADKIANRFNNSGPIIVGPSTVSGNFTVTGIATALGIGVTNSILVGVAVTTKDLTVQRSANIFQANLTGITTAGIVTGATYYGDGVNLSGIVTQISAGTGIVISPVTGKGKVTITASNAPTSDYATNAGLATDVKGGVAGAVLYQVGNNDTGFTAQGNSGEILQSTGTGIPQWVNIAAINVSYADSAGISTDLFGGVPGAIPYQSGIDQTDFFGPGATGLVLLGQGSGAPIFVDPKSSLDVRYARLSGIATNLDGGTVNSIGIANTGPFDNEGRAELDETNISAGLNVVGLATFNDVDINGSIDIDGSLEVDDLNVSGVATFANLADFNGRIEGTDANFTGIVTVGNTLNVTGITTLGVTTTSNLSVNELIVAGVTTLAANSGIVTTGGDLYVGGDLYIADDVVFDEITGRNLNITGVGTINTLGVTGVTTTQSLQVVGVTTTGTLLVGGSSAVPATTDFSEVTLSGQSSSSFNVTYTRQATGFVLDTGTVTSGNALFKADSNYYYYVASSGPQADGRIIIYSEEDAAWIVLLDIGENFTEGNVSDNQALGAVTGSETVTASSETGDGRNVPQSSGTIVYSTSGGGSTSSIGATITTAGNAIFAGIVTAAQLDITGVSTLTGYVEVGTGMTVAGFGITATTLNVSSGSTVGFLTVTDSLYVSGIASVGSAITMYGATGIVSATAFYGDGSNLTNVQGVIAITNQLYVTPDGKDTNDGLTPNTAKRTVGSALTAATRSTVVNITAGTYVEDNPLVLPEQVTVLGDSLREVSIVPRNRNADLIYVSNGSYVENMTFTGTLDEGKAIISFNPEKPSYVTQGPYIRNCTNFISNSIGMKINGDDVLGPTRAMNVDSYTQLNQGGIGVSISNEGYAQLVSIFTIYNDQSIVCVSGGQCDLTNSNSSFGRLGLVADGIGPTNFIGTIPQFVSADSNVFPIDLSVDTFSIENAEYDQTSGLTTITTYKPIDGVYTRGMSINISGLGFTCPPYDHDLVQSTEDGFVNTTTTTRLTPTTGTTYDPTTGLLEMTVASLGGVTPQTDLTATTGTSYDPRSGLLTVVTTGVHGLVTGSYVKFAPDSLTFTCTTDPSSPKTYPRSTDPVFNKWKQVSVINTTTFTMDVGVSSDLSPHTFVSATAGGVKRANSIISIVDSSITFTCALDGNVSAKAYPRASDPASNAVFGVEATTVNTITVNIGKSSDTSAHTFTAGISDSIIVKAQPNKFTSSIQSTYDPSTGALVVDVEEVHGLTAATGLTADAGTTYDPVAGTITVVTSVAHGLVTGDLVKFDEGSVTFTCALDGNVAQKAYPRTTDPVFNKWIQVIRVDATTFRATIGVSPDLSTHTFVSGTTDGILKGNSIINIVDDSINFSCGTDFDFSAHSYPRATDPASNTFIGIEAVTSETFTLNIGKSSDTSTHNALGSIISGFTSTSMGSRFTAQAGTTYNPSTGVLELTIGSGHGLNAYSDLTADTGTTYNPRTGILQVVTTTSHGLTTGDYVRIEPDSLTFTCALDDNATNHTYPRTTDPIYNIWKQVSIVNATTFNLDIGKSSDVTAHTFVSATANGVKKANSLISVVDGAVTFTCATDGNTTQYAYPRLTDPANGSVFGIDATTVTTVSINVGRSSDTSTHTFVSGVTDSIVQRVKADGFTALTSSTYDDAVGTLVIDTGTSTGALNPATPFTAGAGTTYVAATGICTVVTTAPHGMVTGDLVKIDEGALTFTCSQDNNASTHTYPRTTDPIFNIWNQVTVVDANTFSLNVGSTTTGDFTHLFVSGTTDGILRANSVFNIVDDSIVFSCARDNYIAQKAYPDFTSTFSNNFIGVEAVSGNTFTVNIGQGNLNTFPDNFGKVFQVNRVLTTRYTATTGTAYDPSTGILTIVTTVANGLTTGDQILIADNSLTFTCATDPADPKTYPRPTDPASNKLLTVTVTNSTTFTVDVGTSVDTSTHTFVSAVADSISSGSNKFNTYVGVSTIPHVYNSGGNTEVFVTEPYDGQVVYFDSIYNSIENVTITSGGSGYTQAPQLEFSNPSESWGVKATGVARLTGDKVTSVDMISNGRGYTGTPTVTINGSATGTPNILPTYYVVSSATPIVGGISTVTFTENVPYSVGVGTTVPFFKQSRVLASSQAFEYIGSGNTFPDALPQRGGVAIPENEIVNRNGGLVIFTSTDQAGNFKIGKGVVINQLEGSITGDAYNRSLFANITPYILALGGGD